MDFRTHKRRETLCPSLFVLGRFGMTLRSLASVCLLTKSKMVCLTKCDIKYVLVTAWIKPADHQWFTPSLKHTEVFSYQLNSKRTVQNKIRNDHHFVGRVSVRKDKSHTCTQESRFKWKFSNHLDTPPHTHGELRCLLFQEDF